MAFDFFRKHVAEADLPPVALFGKHDMRMTEDELRLALRWAMREYLKAREPKPTGYYKAMVKAEA